MKNQEFLPRDRRNRGGYITLTLVIGMALVAFALLMAAYRATIAAQDIQKVTQVRVDVAQRENAILRSILALTPNRAIRAMSADSVSNANALTWESIFAEALVVANASDSDADGILNDAGVGVARSSNGADFTGTVASIFKSPTGLGLIAPGVNAQLGALYPPYLTTDAATASLDALYPIVTHAKTHGSNTSGSMALLSVSSFPLYNQIPYPNIRFGYGTPGQPFVAKRNHWGFSIEFPAAVPGLPSTRKDYVLSLYEVPSQVALSANAFMSLGRHADGTSWSGVQINGSIFGERILAEESMSLDRISSRNGIQIQAAQRVDGTDVKARFDADDTIQSFESTSSAYFPVSVAAGAGRVAFVPLNRGLDFYRYLGHGTDANRLSPTSWNQYSIGALNCAVRVTVKEAQDTLDQTPVEIDVTFRTDASGGTKTETLRRGSNWPTDNQAGGTLIPFQTEYIEAGRICLVLYIDRLAPWIAARGGAGPAINHSVAINVDDLNGEKIRPFAFPSTEHDLALALRGGMDLTPYTKGFSLVTDRRVYFAGDLNNVALAGTPVGADPADAPFFPPLSIFAPEKRWGILAQQRWVKFVGQLGTLDSGSGAMLRPLDLKSGKDDAIAGNIDAELNEIRSPAQLPPVTFPNWLLTIEEVNPM